MSKQITITAYEFNELSDGAKETARNWYRSGDDGHEDWSEYSLDEAIEQGQLLGIEFDTREVKLMGGGTRQDPLVYFSGFCSQGDGACFSGAWRASDVKVDEVAKDWGDAPATTEIKQIAQEFDRLAKLYPHAYFRVKHSGRYYHENCTDFTVDLLPDEEYEDQRLREEELDAAEAELIEVAKDFMRWIYKQLEAAYTDHNSDETVDANIECNEYLFTESGERTAALWGE